MKAWSSVPEAQALRSQVLAWLSEMRVDDAPGCYRLNAGAEPTSFASCFAVFVRHLFDDLDQEPTVRNGAWLGSLQAYQDPATGLFVDTANHDRGPDPTHDARHLDWQLTTFCLSAIGALGGEPKYPLTCATGWTSDRLWRYLSGLDWRNPWNSGNRAMFLGVVLAYEASRGVSGARSSLDAWFEWHDAHQNSVGFWGHGARARFVDGMGGAFHQFMIYDYCGRPVRFIDRIVDRVLFLQQRDGMYSPWPSGATCYELDAADILVKAFHASSYRRAEIVDALRRVQHGVLTMQNADGGFCWGRRHPLSPADWFRTATGVLRHGSLYYWYYSLRAAAAIQVRRHPMLRTGWASSARAWETSSIFDTWFRCLTLAEIGTVLPDSPFADAGWRFLETAGLGWFQVRGRAR